MTKQSGQYKTIERLITPELAEEYLRGNTNNRNLSKRQIERMVYAMKHDQWKSNGETIKIATSGRLLDGQHRLNAVIQSQCSCLMLVCEGIHENVIDTIDIGKRRTFGDWLNIQGEENYGLLSATLHKLDLYENYYVKNIYVYGNNEGGRKNASYQDLERLLAENPDIRLSVGTISKSEARRLFDRSTLSLMHFLFSKVDTEKASDFFMKLASGANLPDDHPILVLRNTAVKWKANNHKPEHYEAMTFIIRTWNAYFNDKKISFLRFNAEESFPPVWGLEDAENQRKIELARKKIGDKKRGVKKP